MVERAEQKLQMDAAVIQSGRLAEKQKAMTKEDALAAVRFGADKIFRAENAEITDADIDAMLASAKDMTAERNKALGDKSKKELLDFSNADVNFQVRPRDTHPSGREGCRAVTTPSSVRHTGVRGCRLQGDGPARRHVFHGDHAGRDG